MGTGKVVCDSDVIIDFFEETKGRHQQTVISIKEIGEDNVAISLVTEMEL